MIKGIIISLIKGYQYFISPLLGSNCRFNPTCSQYTKEAYQTYPLFKATKLSVTRILKCHPFCAGGEDPLPLKTD